MVLNPFRGGECGFPREIEIWWETAIAQARAATDTAIDENQWGYHDASRKLDVTVVIHRFAKKLTGFLQPWLFLHPPGNNSRSSIRCPCSVCVRACNIKKHDNYPALIEHTLPLTSKQHAVRQTDRFEHLALGVFLASVFQSYTEDQPDRLPNLE